MCIRGWVVHAIDKRAHSIVTPCGAALIKGVDLFVEYQICAEYRCRSATQSVGPWQKQFLCFHGHAELLEALTQCQYNETLQSEQRM